MSDLTALLLVLGMAVPSLGYIVWIKRSEGARARRLENLKPGDRIP